MNLQGRKHILNLLNIRPPFLFTSNSALEKALYCRSRKVPILDVDIPIRESRMSSQVTCLKNPMH